MPHFVIDCSENVLRLRAPEDVLRAVHAAAEATGLFKKGGIKVRVRAFEHYTVGGGEPDFIHIFGNIMEGRAPEQKANLSRKIIEKSKSMFAEVPVISINIRDL